MIKSSKLLLLSLTLVGCSAVADFAASKLLGAGSNGISAELTVGDKEQVLGSNIEVKADKVDKVVGNSDNSTEVVSAQSVEVSNTNYPTWLIITLLLGNVVFLCLPTPTQTWQAYKRKSK